MNLYRLQYKRDKSTLHSKRPKKLCLIRRFIVIFCCRNLEKKGFVPHVMETFDVFAEFANLNLSLTTLRWTKNNVKTVRP